MAKSLKPYSLPKPSKNLRFDNPMPHKVGGGTAPKGEKPKAIKVTLVHAERPPVRKPKTPRSFKY